MATCKFTGLTPKQASVLAEWFSGQGEQDCEPWFDARGVEVPCTIGEKQIDPDGNVTVECS